MTKWLKRKDFTKTFLPLTSKGKQIHVIGRVKQLPYEIVEMALRLSDLDFINTSVFVMKPWQLRVKAIQTDLKCQ